MKFLSRNQFETLLLSANALVPEAYGMPSAQHVLADGRLLSRVLAMRADLASRLPSLLEGLAGHEPVAALAELERNDPFAFDVVFQAVASAYYLDPEVKRLLSYDGQQAQSLPRGGFGGEEFLEKMMFSPKRYRTVPGGGMTD